MEEKVAHDSGVPRIGGPESVGGYVIGGEADHEVGIDQLSLVAHPLVVIKAVERTAVAGAGFGKGPRALAMRNSPFPVELRSAPLLEGRNQSAQLRMHRTAVVALVVILQHDLPVGVDLVSHSSGRAELSEGITLEPFRHRAELAQQILSPGGGLGRRKGQENEPAPAGDAYRIKREIVFSETGFLVEKGSAPETAVEPIGPGVVRTANGATEAAPGTFRHQTRAAMATHVVMCRQGAVPGSHHQHAFSQNIEGLVVSRVGPIFLSAGAEPLPEENVLGLAPENLLRKIEVPVKSSFHHRAASPPS